MMADLMTFGPIAAIIAMWNQIRGFLQRLTSYVVVSFEIHGTIAEATMGYLWRNFKTSRIGKKRYIAIDIFVKPSNRYESVPFESSGKALTFFKGWKPLFVSQGFNNNGDPNNMLTISFVRGLFNTEELLINAIDEYNHRKQNANGKTRFRIEKLFGSILQLRNDQGNKTTAPSSGDERNIKSFAELETGIRPLKYTLSDLGAPTSKKPFEYLALNNSLEEMKVLLQQWKESEQWYLDHGLDWRFGVCAYGSAGTGKSSFIRAIAQLLDIPIFSFDLNSMNNQDLVKNWQYMLEHAPCVALFEDIDRLFDKDGNFNVGHKMNQNAMTLDSLLNCISGVEQSNGVLTFITANDISRIDSALGILNKQGESTRPGRIDKLVEFISPDATGRTMIANRILTEFDPLTEILPLVNASEGETGAQFTKKCELLAIKRYWERKKVKYDTNT